MKRKTGETNRAHPQNPKVKHMVLTKMLPAGIACGVIGVLFNGYFGYYLLMWICLAFIVSCVGCNFLLKRNIISLELAAAVPLLILTFIYTPVHWFVFNGMMGGSLYIVILFTSLILLTDFNRGAWFFVGGYLILTAGLIVNWFVRFGNTQPLALTLGSLLEFIVALALIIVLISSTTRRSAEISNAILLQSMQDELTGLYNRRALDMILERAEQRYLNEQVDYLAIMLDIDDFKHINDFYGHVIGDSVLRSLAQRIRETIRNWDFALRYGGDEMLLILSISGEENARRAYDRVESAMRSIPGYAFEITVSAGGARRSECDKIDELVAFADQRMYAQKRCRETSLLSPDDCAEKGKPT